MKMKLNVEMKATKEQIDAVVNNEALTKSGKIKELFMLGLEVKEISVATGIVYNMCYNVVTNYVLTNGLEVVKEKKESKKDVIFGLFAAGMTNMQVAKDTQTNYNYVCKLRKEWKMGQEQVTEALESAVAVGAEAAAVEEPQQEQPRGKNGRFVKGGKHQALGKNPLEGVAR